MTPPAARRTAPGLPFGRRLAISMVAASLLPLLVFGTFVIGRIDGALASASDARVREALMAVEAVVARREQSLAETAGAYADWSVLRELIDDGRLDTVRRDVLGFLEGRGVVDTALAEIDGRLLATATGAGPDQLVQAASSLAGTTGIVTVDGGMYLVAAQPIATPATDPAARADIGPRPPPEPDRLVLAERLDAGFIQEVRRLTGFDVAVVLPDGTIAVAGDPEAAAALGGLGAAESGTRRQGQVVGGWTTAGHPGQPAGRWLLTTRQEATDVLLGQLPAFLLASLAVAVVLSVLVSTVMSRGLNERLAVIHDGLTAVAAGRRPGTVPLEASPDVERLAVALDTLVDATERRERILRDASVSLAELHPSMGAVAVARAATATAIDIFGFRSCAIVRADGTTEAQVGTTDETAGIRLEAPLDAPSGDAGALVAHLPPGVPWTEADAALVEMYARLVGGILRDAHDHDLTSDRLERLGRLNDLQREFLRSVSHNLQTPLTTISLVADDLADPAASTSPEVRARQIQAIRAQAARLERLVAQIITVSRLDAGRLHLERDAVSVAPIVRRVWASLDSGRELRLDVRSGASMTLGDREAIEQIVWILLDNAVRYAPSGPIEVRTVAATEGADARIRIEVRDAGPGVPEGERRSIFRRFWSGAAGRSRGGTGIGLDIARRLARAMGGTLRFEPGEPVGSVFILTLPADDARPA